MEAAALFSYLGLPDTADEKEVRRAYARELKKIDQETSPGAFQELRETYERLMLHLRRQQVEVQAETAAPAPAPAPVVEAEPEPAPAPAAPTPEEVGRQCIGLLVERLKNSPFRDRDDAEAFLQDALNSDALANVDARQFYEWAVASILASGWRPGHELLLTPAIDVFGWKKDRSRLLYLGQAGHVIDTVIAEIASFDSQNISDRIEQREVIRALREDGVPKTTQLLKTLPLAEFVAAAFPAWIFVAANSQAVAKWREAAEKIPKWRRKLVRNPRPAPGGARPKPQAESKSGYGWLWLAFIVISGIANLARNDPPKSPGPYVPPLQQNSATQLRSQFERDLKQSHSSDLDLFSTKTQSGDFVASESYANRVARAIRQNIVYSDPSKTANPEAEVEITCALDGLILEWNLVRPSGTRAWDYAVLRALEKTNRIPTDIDGRVPTKMRLVFRLRG
jgi:hypothetical protein